MSKNGESRKSENSQKAANDPAKQQLALLQENGDINYIYYQQYAKLYYASMLLSNRLQQLIAEKEEIGSKLERINNASKR